ncbi:MAG: hypothetical protein RL211_2118, partial [Pseudomonadota bacterium]
MRTFTLSDFDFTLPPKLIAQHPAPERSGSRLLDGTVAPQGRSKAEQPPQGAAQDTQCQAWGPTSTQPVDRIFRDLPSLLNAGDLLVFNDTKVIKARLFGEKPTGGKLELLIERVLSGNQVAAHMRVSKKPEVGTTVALVGAPGTHEALSATLLGRWPDAQGALFRFVLSNDAGDDPHTLMERHGHVPLPPYIDHTDSAEDAARYQTVFAKNPGAVAAPTAALHFDDALLAALDARGVLRASVTLHVGAGTFQPVRVQRLAEHRMHSEWYEVGEATVAAIEAARARAGRVIAVGTTSLRALESAARLAPAAGGSLSACRGETDIFITPGHEFRVVQGLLTNFHLPRSTLMMLVSALAGHERIMALYRLAVEQR